MYMYAHVYTYIYAYVFTCILKMESGGYVLMGRFLEKHAKPIDKYVWNNDRNMGTTISFPPTFKVQIKILQSRFCMYICVYEPIYVPTNITEFLPLDCSRIIPSNSLYYIHTHT